jgi:glycosyltransferase involved in cell wall biosynthesis
MMTMNNMKIPQSLQDLIAEIPKSNGSAYYGSATRPAVVAVADSTALDLFRDACDITCVNTDAYKQQLIENKFDFLLCIGSRHWSIGDIDDVVDIVVSAKEIGLLTVLYAIDDPAQYDRCFPIARKSDFIFTSAVERVDDYKNETGNANVFGCTHVVNPMISNPLGMMMRYSGCQNGHEDGDRHGKRIALANSGEIIFDGTAFPFSASKFFDFVRVVNAVQTSITMCQTSVFELQAQGVNQLSNYALAVSTMFPGVFMTENETEESRIIHGYSQTELISMQIDGVRNVFSGYTVYDRLNYMFERMGLATRWSDRTVAVLVNEFTEEMRSAVQKQTWKHLQIITGGKVVAGDSEAKPDFAIRLSALPRNRHYIEDLVNAYKYVDVAFVRYGSWGNLISNYQYMNEVPPTQNALINLAYCSLEEVSAGAITRELSGISILEPKWGRDTSGTEKELAVIIPVYNNGRFLEGRAFRSLLRSSIFDRMQIYLIDDGSTDVATRSTVESLSDSYDNVTACYYEKGGSGSAARPRNRGMAIAKEPYTTFLDPDNEAIEDGYAVLLNKFKTALGGDSVQKDDSISPKDTAFISGDAIVVRNDAVFEEYTPVEKQGLELARDSLLARGFGGRSHQAMVFKTGFLKDNDIKEIEGSIGADTLFYFEVCVAPEAYGIYTNDTVFIYYCERAGSVVNSIGADYFRRCLLRERSQFLLLKESGLLDAYMKMQYKSRFDNLYLEQLKKCSADEHIESLGYLQEIARLYYG